MPVRVVSPIGTPGKFRIRSSKKQKTTNQWRCGPTSISGSVLLCPVLFCELKPFYRSQWPFSSESHVPYSDESSSADMFFSKQYLLSVFRRRKYSAQIPWNFLRTAAEIHLPYIIPDSHGFVKLSAKKISCSRANSAFSLFHSVLSAISTWIFSRNPTTFNNWDLIFHNECGILL